MEKLFKNSQVPDSSQPNPNPDHDRTVKPVVCPHRGAPRSQEIETRSFPEEAVKHDRTVTPVVCRDASHAQGHEIQRQNSESEQIRTLLDRQREQILGDCQAEIRKHEFQADYDRRSIEKLNETIKSQKEEIHRAQAEERRPQNHQLLHEQLLKQSWDLREAHEKSLTEMEEIEAISGFLHSTQLQEEDWSKIKILSLNSGKCKMKSIV